MILSERNLEEKLARKSRDQFWKDLAGAARFAFSLAQRKTVSEWADENRMLGYKTSAEHGHWRTDRTPYLRDIMNAFNDRNVEEITIKASTQVGKTESLLNMIGYAVDQEPGPALLVMPRKDDAKYMSKDRLVQMIELSDTLSKHLTEEEDDVTQFILNLDRMNIYMAWANSPAALASKPIKYVFFDEPNKYPPFSGKEADPIKLGTERTRTFWDRKIVKVSTPTTKDGYISREYDRSDQCKYYVPCPHCGKYQILIWHQVKKPLDEHDPDKIKAYKLAWYECIECKKAIIDVMKQGMLLKGKWVPAACTINKDGDIIGPRSLSKHRGFWLNALYSPWLTFAEMMYEWLCAQGRNELLMNFVNSWLGEEWEEKGKVREPEKLKKLKCDYEEAIVPERAIILTAGVDVQQDHFYYVIRAWGVGYESWKIESNQVETWEEVIDKVFNRMFPSANKTFPEFNVSLTAVDSGHRTSEVYDVCRSWVGPVRPIKGQDSLSGLLYKMSNIDKYPDGKIIAGGLKLYHIDTNMMKDKLARLINSEQPKFHLHKTTSEEYIKQMCGEAKTPEKGKKKGTSREVWKKVSAHVMNNFWDCEVYALAAAEMLRVYALKEDDLPKPVQPVAPRDVKEASWIGNRKGWMRPRE